MKNNPISNEHVPLLRRALTSNDNAELRAVASRGKIMYLVVDDITQAEMDIWDQLITAAREGMGPHFSPPLQAVRDAILPYVGKQLLRAALWMEGRQYEIYVDPVTTAVVHCGSGEHPDPDGRSAEEAARLLAGGGPGLFGRDDLRRQQETLARLDVLPVEEVRLDCSQMESTAIIQRANTFPFCGLSHFWINSQRHLDAKSWAIIAVKDALCQPIGENEFLQLLAQCLYSPMFEAKLASLGQFVHGQWMVNEWNNQSAVAEIGGWYYAAYWSTFG